MTWLNSDLTWLDHDLTWNKFFPLTWLETWLDLTKFLRHWLDLRLDLTWGLTWLEKSDLNTPSADSSPDCILRTQPLPAKDDQQQKGAPPESVEGTHRFHTWTDGKIGTWGSLQNDVFTWDVTSVATITLAGPDGKLGGDSPRLQEEFDEQCARYESLLRPERRGGGLGVGAMVTFNSELLVKLYKNKPQI